MISKSEAIVLKQIKYSDSARILTVYSLDQGRLALFLRQASGGKNRRKALYQPLSIIEYVTTNSKEDKQMKGVKEITLKSPNHHIRNDIFKTTIALFVAEVLHKCIVEEERNAKLYQFICTAIYELDAQTEAIGYFPLQFLLKLSSYMGFQPDTSGYTSDSYFDLMEGEFTITKPHHGHDLSPELGLPLLKTLESNYGFSPGIGANQKRDLLNGVLEYYRLHLPEFGELKSHAILQQVLN